jgi:hypothetical protein
MKKEGSGKSILIVIILGVMGYFLYQKFVVKNTPLTLDNLMNIDDSSVVGTTEPMKYKTQTSGPANKKGPLVNFPTTQPTTGYAWGPDGKGGWVEVKQTAMN